eukprot:TRINITY_DN9312_c0_g1_i1.p1 TRINITY_DN9312_c0_g1~~TRINITY_DN9312_c0_g1_i1.p1  ORF type:complete len:406 (+),score=53.33 TRINITY_DN9312_c0_g1_i1:765-1982(+)
MAQHPGRKEPPTAAEVGPRYKLLKKVGSGAFGLVWSATDLHDPSARAVAIKKVTNAFEHTTDTKRLLREILLLRHLDHVNILCIKDLMCPKDANQLFSSLFIVTELMDTDLHHVIQSPQQLSDQHVQYFVYQLLRALKYLHSAGIIHRDVKPSNLLLNENCQLKLCDFGLARSIPARDEDLQEEDNFMTEYVVTRWYRAPELLLQERYYDGAIDVWSVGCVLAELLGRKPVFPGSDYIDEIIKITNIVGTPTEHDLSNFGSEAAREFIRSLQFKESIPWDELFPKAEPLAIDLLTQMLKFDPAQRLTADEALQHPYLAANASPEDECTAPQKYKYPYDGCTLDKYQMKEIIFQQVIDFHPESCEDLQLIRDHHAIIRSMRTGAISFPQTRGPRGDLVVPSPGPAV